METLICVLHALRPSVNRDKMCIYTYIPINQSNINKQRVGSTSVRIELFDPFISPLYRRITSYRNHLP